MKLYINKKNFEFENNKASVDQLLETIDIEIENSDELLDYMDIDGVKVFTDYKEYISNNIRIISEIKVLTLSKKELIEDTLITGLEYIENALPIIEILSDGFYTFPKEDDWDSLTDLIDGLSWIFNSFIVIDNDKSLIKHVDKREGWNIYSKSIYELSEVLEELKEGMERQDNVLIGDILSYEIVPIFESMTEEILDIVKVEK